MYYANRNQKGAGTALLISDKIRLKTKKFTKGHFIQIKRLIHKENIIIINIYAPNNTALRYMNQKLTELKGK